MYQPPAFKEDRVPVLHAAIRRIAFANLITAGPDGLTASAVPMLLDPDPAPYGTLVGHVSRANPQWRHQGAAALAIFMGPDAYITPSWYATKRQTGKVVPTWNYATIHAHGTVEFFNDPGRLLELVRRLTDRHEGDRAARGAMPWAVSDAPADFIAGQLKGIVGFALPISRLEGKWKMSQNRPAEDRAGVVQGLAEDGEAEMAAIVADPQGRDL
ncbi:MAG TPA: FMN-binding negative transcriptional regulator [Acetobacteraceae bacterium]|nr:FMN-binding negative transcriptional regulator [Acetobacteraceae bacterium]